MRAILSPGPGPADTLSLVELPDPVPPKAGVVVRVHAASVNPVDWKLRSGELPIPGRFLPKIPGGDFAGVVESVGAGSRWQVGEKVWGHISAMGGGAYAEWVAVADKHLDRMPSALSFVQAASLPLAGLTAYQGLVQQGALEPGQRVLVNGCTGGVGVVAVQVAKALGAEVTGVCSAKNAALAGDLGCDAVVDYRAQEVLEVEGPFELWFDAVGNQSPAKVAHQLTPRGRYLSTLPTMTAAIGWSLRNLFAQRRAFPLMVRPSGPDLAALRALVEAGALKPVVEAVFPLAEVAEAHRRSQGGRVVGKLVLEVG